MGDAREDLIPSLSPALPPEVEEPARPDIRFDMARTPELVAFLRRTGLGFVREIKDGCAKDGPEIDDIDVGLIGSRLSLDLDL